MSSRSIESMNHGATIVKFIQFKLIIYTLLRQILFQK